MGYRKFSESCIRCSLITVVGSLAACIAFLISFSTLSPSRLTAVLSGGFEQEERYPEPRNESSYHEHFLRSLSPYSGVRYANIDIARKSFLTSENVPAHEQFLLSWFVKEYLHYHRTNRRNATKYLLHVPRRTGIGDRIQYLIFAYWLAVISNRVLLVDWEHPFPLREFLKNTDAGVNMFYNETEDRKYGICSGPRGSEDFPYMNMSRDDSGQAEHLLLSDTKCVISHDYKRAKHYSEKMLTSFAPKNITSKQIYSIKKSTSFSRAILHHVFTVHDSIFARQANFSKSRNLYFPHDRLQKAPERRNTIRGRPFIGVHARIGKGVGEGGWRFENVSAKQEKVAKCLASRAVHLSVMDQNEALPVYLATDTTGFRDIFSRIVAEMSQQRITVYSGEWDVIHSNRMTPVVEDEPEIQDEGLRNVLLGSYLDLVMLGHARHIVATYSSFSRMALALGDAQTLVDLRNDICLEQGNWKL